MAEVVQKETEADGTESRIQLTAQDADISLHHNSNSNHPLSPANNNSKGIDDHSGVKDCESLSSCDGVKETENCKKSTDIGTCENQSCVKLDTNAITPSIEGSSSCETTLQPSVTCEDSCSVPDSAGDNVHNDSLCTKSSQNDLNEVLSTSVDKCVNIKSNKIVISEKEHSTDVEVLASKDVNDNGKFENKEGCFGNKSESELHESEGADDTDVKMEDVSDHSSQDNTFSSSEQPHDSCPKENIDKPSEANPELKDSHEIKNGDLSSSKEESSDIKKQMEIDEHSSNENLQCPVDESMDVQLETNDCKESTLNQSDVTKKLSCSVIKVNKDHKENISQSPKRDESNNKTDSNIDIEKKNEKNSELEETKTTKNEADSLSLDRNMKSDKQASDKSNKLQSEIDIKDCKGDTGNKSSVQENLGTRKEGRVIHRSQRPGPKSKKIQIESSEGSSSDEGKGDEPLANGEKDKGREKRHSHKEGEKKNTENESEMKGYITDTMNELLGLFGYDQVDESTKNKLQLGKVDTPTCKDKIANATPKTLEAPSNKSQSESSKPPETTKKSSRSCAECGVTKGLKFQVLFQGTTRFLCSDACFQVFRSKQKLAPPSSGAQSNRNATSTSAPSTVTPSQVETCAQCRKEIKNGQGYFPPTGENKPLCSEDCMQKYLQIHGPKQVCAQCKSSIQGRTKCLTWETMEFCNEDCLGKYQAYLGSHCTCCQVPVQQSSLGKYCVRFGSDIRQFCSGRCLEEFKKGLKVCSFCQKDLSSGQEGFLAPVGDKGQFKDFCTQQCMERYETMNSTTSSTPQVQQCSFCKKVATIKVRVKFEDKSYALCSDPCIAAFRYTNKINTSICDTCHKFFDSEAIQPFSLQFEGSSKRFCSKACMNLFVLSHRKIVPCTWCKVKKYNFDMIERVDSNNHVQLFCSLNCLSLFRVSLNATSSRSVRCDHCQQNLPAQYHLTMSDASIRNFCCYQCVIQFQNQFTNVPTLTTATPSVRQSSSSTSSTQSGASKTTVPQNSTPVISSVISLAPTQLKAASPSPSVSTSQPTPKVVVPQKVIPVRQQTTQPPPLAIISTKSPSCVSTTTTQSVATHQPSSQSQVIREVIVKPPPPKALKNKTVLCKPIMQTKGVSCKPHPCHKAVQTDENDGTPVLMPIPVPVYIPTPVHMYSRPVPCPLPFPLPIPVPVFIPTTKSSAAQILKHIREIQEKIPTNPFEAELLMMAEMIAGDDNNKIKDEGSTSNKADPNINQPLSKNEDDVPPQVKSSDEPAMDLEEALPALPAKDQENDSASGEENLISPRELRARHRSRKRASSGNKGRNKAKKKPKLEPPSVEDSDSLIGGSLEGESNNEPSLSQTDSPDANMYLKYTFGVNAWKHWVLEKNAQLEKGSQSSRKLKLFKTDLLQLSPDELNYSLCLFVKEVRKPSGDEYAPDSIYYLCLGIQQYLFENGRIDNIFTDSYYEKFTECLNEVLQKQDVVIDTEGCFISRIEEEILWESKQLGAHSPHVLLNTLMHFNTKFFMLKTVDEHMHLSFSHITKHWRKTPLQSKPGSTARNVVLRYFPPVNKDSRRRREENLAYEQAENVDNPLRCPVKLYEFYLSKCPESVKTRNDVFYLYPERSCVPDSPVWYSTQPLGRETVYKMLQRIRMVREINEVYQEYNSQAENCN